MDVYKIPLLLKNKKLSAQKFISDKLKQIKKADNKYKFALSLFTEYALTKAKAIDNKIARGGEVGRLAGIPFGIKDNIAMKYGNTTCGSKILQDYKSPYAAKVIDDIEKEDGIIIGKTNMDEFAMGSSTEYSYFHKTLNPWDTSRVPGGSSGGSAAMVSAVDECISLGSDTGGSVRQPAAFCGVVGLKPTYGSISRYGLIAFSSSLDQIGIMGRKIKEVAYIFDYLKKEDKRDASMAHPLSGPDTFEKLECRDNFKIAVPYKIFENKTEPAIIKSTNKIIENLKTKGYKVEEVPVLYDQYYIPIYYTIASAEVSSNLSRFDGVRFGLNEKSVDSFREMFVKNRSEGFGQEVKRRIMIGTFILSAGYEDKFYQKAQKLQRDLSSRVDEIFTSYDAILLPTTPTTAFKFGEKSGKPLDMYHSDFFTSFANITGNPAITIPAGNDENNLPIGLQLVGDKFREDKIFGLAYRIEKLIKEINL